MTLGGKAAIVTGGGSGFGEGIAALFAAEGARVLVADIDGQQAHRVADAITRAGGDAKPCVADVSQRADFQRMVDDTLAAFGRLDIVVNNAGVSHKNTPMLEVDEAEFDRVFAVNVKSIYWSAICSVPVLRQQGGGSIINIASTAGLRPRPGLTWYNGSKGAAVIISKSMAVELAPDNIRVNAICPVIGETALTSTFMGGDTPELRAKFTASIPLGRMSQPEDIAGAALYLASDRAAFMTGTALEVDGGRCI
ncbi:MAG: glucose 1-dehydrogenase [Pseudomonadota bacterium]